MVKVFFLSSKLATLDTEGRPPSKKPSCSRWRFFFSYWSSVFSNTDAKTIRCLKNIFQNSLMIEF
jgi:hypothetical protein